MPNLEDEPVRTGGNVQTRDADAAEPNKENPTKSDDDPVRTGGKVQTRAAGESGETEDSSSEDAEESSSEETDATRGA